MNRFKRVAEILLVISLGLVPLLWFEGEKIILGHDAGLPLSPVSHFIDRLYVWTYRFGFGNDQSYAIPGFFIHGLEALVGVFDLGNQFVQKVTFVFWFTLPGLTMLYLSKNIERELNLKYFALASSIFYMMNHFLMQGWFVAERTKFSLYAATPLIVAFLFYWERGRRSNTVTAIYISLTLFVLNGMASLPLFGGLIIVLSVYALSYVYRKRNFGAVKKLVSLAFFIGVFSFMLNSYWLLAYFSHVLSSYAQTVELFGGVEGIMGWVRYVSENSSYANLLRLQGIPEWYQNPAHPYANTFLNNYFFISFSLLVPLLAFGSQLVYKEKRIKRYITLFSLVAIVALIFSAGTHPPFGIFYSAFMEYVPGFIAFRNPFYKFSAALWFSYALLIGFTFSYIVSKLSVISPRIMKAFIIVSLLGYSAYNYPFFSGIFFDYIKDERSMRVEVPSYIYDYGEWSEQDSRINTRTLVLPPPNKEGKVEAYNWGYWSLAPLTSLLTNAQIINDSIYLTQTEQDLLASLYAMMERNDPAWKKMAEFLGINSILLRNDFAWNLSDSPTNSPESYVQLLADEDLMHVISFGEWEVYDFKNSERGGKASVYGSVNYLIGDAKNIPVVLSMPNYSDGVPIFVKEQNSVSLPPHLVNSHILAGACVMCDMQWPFVNNLAHVPTLTRGSLLYPLIEGKFEKQENELKNDKYALSKFLASRILRDTLAYQKVLNEGAEVELFSKINSDIQLSISKLSQVVSEVENSNLSINEDMLNILSFVRNSRFILIQVESEHPQVASQDSFLHTINEVDELFELIEDIVIRTETDDEKTFAVEAEKSADYNLYLQPSAEIAGQSYLSVNSIQIDFMNQASYENGWYLLRDVPLGSGLNEVKVRVKNPVEYENEYIRIYQQNSCFETGTIESSKNDIFKLTFDHSLNSEFNKFFIAYLPTGQSEFNPQNIEVLESTKMERNYTGHFAASNDKGFRLFICNRDKVESGNVFSDIEISNMLIEKLVVPNLIFVEKNLESVEGFEVVVNRKDQTEYEISMGGVGQERLLLFKDSYNKNWKLGKRQSQLIINGYANGWILEKDVKAQALKYRNQNLFKYGSALTVVTLLVMLGYLVYLKKKR